MEAETDAAAQGFSSGAGPKPGNRQISSLDRFVNGRGPVFAGVTDDSRRILALGFVGGFYAVMGVGLVASGLMHSGAAQVIPGLSFLTCGTVVTGVREWLRRRPNAEMTCHAPVTPEARALLRSLIAHLNGWAFGPRMRRLRLRRAMRRGLLRSMHDRRCEDVLSPAAFRVLDDAARELNRIGGALALDQPPAGSTLGEMAPNIRAAADEAMAEILHDAALLDRYPEGAARLEEQARQRIAGLRTLADHVQRLQSTGDVPLQAGTSASRIENVLEQLRADEQARAELGVDSTEAEVQRLR
jgi:hypothetical protein